MLKLIKNLIYLIEEFIISNTRLIGKPAMNQLKYYVYDKINKTLKTVHLSKRQIEEININFFSRKTSYCNGEINCLYMKEIIQILMRKIIILIIIVNSFQ